MRRSRPLTALFLMEGCFTLYPSSVAFRDTFPLRGRLKDEFLWDNQEVCMNPFKNSRLTGNAQGLRRNMTKEEKHLWYDFLKSLPQTVQHQKVIGKYIVDFYCASARIAIELDGSQHYEEKSLEYDRVRDEYFNEQEITVLRYSNLEIHKNFKGVCDDISSHINALST